MAQFVLVLTDTPDGNVDMAVHCEPATELGQVQLPSDTPVIGIARQVLRATVVAAKLYANHNHRKGSK